MRIGYCSDLHLDSRININTHINIKCDVLVLAGDIVEYRHYEEYRHWFNDLSKRYKHVIYVLGNHEYYGSSINTCVSDFRKKLPKNFTILDNDYIEFGDTIIYGGTMWSDCKNISPIESFDIKRIIKDFRTIEGMSFDFMREQNKLFFDNLEKIKTNKKLVVISHFSPSFYFVEDKFINSTLNGYFNCERYEYIYDSNIKHWIFGHLHIRDMVTWNTTNVYCNCYLPDYRTFRLRRFIV